jgi:cell division initiation protein
MRITPIDIRQQQFNTRFRGFDQQEVDAFLEDVAEDYEAMLKENGILKEQLAALEERTRGLAEREKALQNTLVLAQQMSEQIKEAARQDAQLAVREAHLQGEKLLEEARSELGRLRGEIATLTRTRRELREGLRATVETYQRLLDSDVLEDLPHADPEEI